MRRTMTFRLWPPPRLSTNPVLIRELRGRFRGRQAFVIVTLAQAALAALVFIALGNFRYASIDNGYSAMRSGQGGAELGRLILGTLAFTLLFIVTIIAPGLSFNAVSGEKERRTWDLLVATPLPLRSIVRGKYLSALAYVALLSFSALPFFSLAFLFGGVSPGGVFNVIAVLLSAGALGTAVALFLSTVTGRTARAAVLSFLAVVLMTFAPFLLPWLFGLVLHAFGFDFDLLAALFSDDGTWGCIWPFYRLLTQTNDMMNMSTATGIVGALVMLGMHLGSAELLLFGAAGNIRAQLQGRRGTLAGFGWLGLVVVLWLICAGIMRLLISSGGSC